MNAKQRREKILSILYSQTRAISATQLADKFEVSRQIIVGDIALLRAKDHDIIATNQGYFLSDQLKSNPKHFTGRIACQHDSNRIEEELKIVISHGGAFENVQVDHPVYGMITAPLKIETEKDINHFMSLMNENNPDVSSLSSLTNGIHTHTIVCDDIIQFNSIKQALKEANILLSDH